MNFNGFADYDAYNYIESILRKIGKIEELIPHGTVQEKTEDGRIYWKEPNKSVIIFNDIHARNAWLLMMEQKRIFIFKE
jgi:hypothetical protein